MKGQPGPHGEDFSHDGSYLGRVSEWTDREMQLARLHEEILSRRDINLSYSVAYVQSQRERRKRGELVDIDKARERNEKYLQDLVSKRDMLYRESCNPPSPRLTTLQSNYWAMVKSMRPLWEKSLEQRETTYALASSRSQNTARSQRSTGPKTVTIQRSESQERLKSQGKQGSKVKIQKPERKSKKN